MPERILGQLGRNKQRFKEPKVNMINELKRFNADTTQLEDTIVLSAVGKLVRAEYEARNVEVPAWLDDVNRRLTRAIDTQTREAKELRRKELLATKSGLETREEKRLRVEAELAALDGDLAAK